MGRARWSQDEKERNLTPKSVLVWRMGTEKSETKKVQVAKALLSQTQKVIGLRQAWECFLVYETDSCRFLEVTAVFPTQRIGSGRAT